MKRPKRMARPQRRAAARACSPFYDVDDEPIPPLCGYDQMRVDQRSAAIEAATPAWVRRCRALGHFVALGEPTPGVFTFHCTRCGKDRP